MKNRAVFLGRDGVINRYIYNGDLGGIDSPARADEFELLPGACEAVADLNHLGLPVIVVSNQPGIGKGRFTPQLLDGMNEKMRIELAKGGARLSAVLYCRHHPEAVLAEYRRECDCRKPAPGLFFRAARERNLDLPSCFFIGNGVADIRAGCAASVVTVLLSPRSVVAGQEFSSSGAIPHMVVRNLAQAVTAIRDSLSAPGTRGVSSGSSIHAEGKIAIVPRAVTLGHYLASEFSA